MGARVGGRSKRPSSKVRLARTPTLTRSDPALQTSLVPKLRAEQSFFASTCMSALDECGILANAFLGLHGGEYGRDKLLAFSRTRSGSPPEPP